MTTVNLHVSGESHGLPLVLLAPFPLDSRVWEGVVRRLTVDAAPGAPVIRVVAVDPPGFAGATAEGEPSLEAYTQALLDVLDGAGIEKFVAAGNSMGGYVVMTLAEQHPERLAGVALVGTKSSADDDEAKKKRLEGAQKALEGAGIAELVAPMNEGLISPTTRANNQEAVDTLKRWLDEAPAAGFAWGQQAMAERPDRTEALAGLDVPAVILHGADDSLMSAETQLPMAEALGVEVTTLADAGHLLPLEAPDEVAEALTRVWERAAARG